MNHFERLFERYQELVPIRDSIQRAYNLMETCYAHKGKVLICGNGGSCCDSDHMVGELMKGFYKERRLPDAEKEKYEELGAYLQGALPAIALTQHSALSTAYANDVNPHLAFAQQVYGYGREHDLFLGISTSGNSINIVNAAKVAAKKGLKIISLTGKDGGQLKQISDVCVLAPSSVTADIQEFHLPIYHTLCAMLEEHFFPEAS